MQRANNGFHLQLGGPTWKVRLGRGDSATSNKAEENTSIPSPFINLPTLLNNFKNQGLNVKDLVVLYGAHTLGFSRCLLFKDRIHNRTHDIEASFANSRRISCPREGDDTNLAKLDNTPAYFDTQYFDFLLSKQLLQLQPLEFSKKGLWKSDQALYSGGETNDLVQKYSANCGEFWKNFRGSMIKMGNIKPLTGESG